MNNPTAFDWYMSDGKAGLQWGEVDAVQEEWVPIDENLEVFVRINDYLNKEVGRVNIRDALENISVDVDNTGIFNNVAQKNKIDATASGLANSASGVTSPEELAEMARYISGYNDEIEKMKCDNIKREMRKAAQEWNDTHEDDQIKYDAWITQIDTFFDMGKEELYWELKNRHALPFDESIAFDRPANTKYENSKYARGV